jgi:DNA-binding NarL/FixJ family response regulator
MNSVLIVDSEEQVRISLYRAFARAGMIARAESNECENTSPDAGPFSPDLLVLGLKGPAESYLACVKRLRKKFQGLPIFVLTDHYDYKIEKQLLLLGITAVFPRSGNPASVLRNAQAVCNVRFG